MFVGWFVFFLSLLFEDEYVILLVLLVVDVKWFESYLLVKVNGIWVWFGGDGFVDEFGDGSVVL